VWRDIHGLDSSRRVVPEVLDLLGDPSELQVSLLLGLDLVLGQQRTLIDVRLDQVVSATGSGFE
jgi:hypothetical protein